MKILIIGGNGTIGKKVTQRLSANHEVITAGRSSGDIQVDIRSEESIKYLFDSIKTIDACICTAASGTMDNFKTLTQAKLHENMQGKLFGQMNLVLIGQHFLNDGGSFTLTSGIFADHPAKGVTGGGVISGALHSFILSAALELDRGLRVNAVSPGMAEESAKDFASFFPDLTPIPMQNIEKAYVRCIEENINGEILKVYK
ncbi:short chain dehydrogenase [Olivibacter sp. SDN3]|uniref:short chain dehydrogenase n=1 Tax=Olivibacter sp. SDN3 TaxID=2764720 RepID=UPI0016515E87|nr:short chain dehydrogenase [Olivibacter sp. SDN3]QNL48271.1 short chain dehydrogenase [Olivibacter sp. SDN3]